MGWLFAAPFLLALAAPLLHRLSPRHTGRLLALLVAGMFTAIALSPDHPYAATTSWAPSLGFSLSFLYDGLGRLMALVITGVGALVLLYAGGYLKGDERLGRLYASLLAFMGSMLGVVLGGNLLFIFLCWELTSITSFLLIGFDHERPAARAAALQALLVTGAGGLCMLAGILMLGEISGSYELAELARSPGLRDHALYAPALILMLLGTFTKSAQFPFHFWLPGAMEAPTPVSAYLHSATMVKAGVFLLARLSGILGDTELWHWLLVGFGGTTMLIGNIGSLAQTDLKKVLAYSTVGMLGTLTLLIGIGTPAAASAAVVMLAAHALYKGALFLVAGALDHEAGTRDVRELSGLAKALPITFAAASLAALSCMGMIPLLGFIAKEKTYLALLGAPQFSTFIVAAGVAANAAAAAMAAITGLRPFLGKRMATTKHIHEAPLDMWLGPVVLGAAGLALGLSQGQPVAELLGRATAALHGTAVDFRLQLWAGVEGKYGVALALSAGTLALGAVLFVLRSPVRRAFAALAPLAKLSPQKAYTAIYDGSLGFAGMLTRLTQSGLLNAYLRTIVVVVVGLSIIALVRQPQIIMHTDWTDVRLHELGLVALILVPSLMAVRSRSRMAAVAAMGVVGLGVTLIFALFSGPDLAMTQIMVETLTILLFVLVFYHLPQYARLSTRYERVRDLMVSAAFGGLMTVLVLAASTDLLDKPLADYFAAHSLTKGHGRNVVNVILVDFRALDTLGEITVLAAAGIGVVALLRLKGNGRKPA